MRKLAMLCAAALVTSYVPAFAKTDPAACRSYLVMVEQDQVTVNMQMTGLNGPQREWYSKDGDRKEYSGVCYLDADSTGRRVPIEVATQSGYMDKEAESSPLYVVFWEEHSVLVPDNTGGHYALSSNGTLMKYDPTWKDSFRPIGPVHNTNRTILSSSSVSLLKDAIKQIREIQ